MAKKVGEITHYFDHISVGIVKVESPFKVGDKIQIKGHTTDFEQEVKEMQLEHESIEEAKKGKEVGVKVKDHVREGDEVFMAE
jgi:putative protease